MKYCLWLSEISWAYQYCGYFHKADGLLVTFMGAEVSYYFLYGVLQIYQSTIELTY